MKCPKCDYLAFDEGDRCKNCGYSFSLSQSAPVAQSGPYREPPPPPRMTEARPVDSPGPRAEPGRPEAGGTDHQALLDRVFNRPLDGGPLDLPLFATPLDRTTVQPAPPPRPPLSVRKAAPTPQRARPRPGRPTPVDLDLGLEAPSPTPLPAPPPVPAAAPGARPANDELAGPRRRVLAVLVDVLVLGVIDVAVLYFTMRISGVTLSEIGLLPPIPLAGFYLLLDIGYLIVFIGIVGQTLGKMATGIKVVSADGARLDLARSTLRALGCVVTAATLGIGFLPALAGGERALHDRLARTRVCRLTP